MDANLMCAMSQRLTFDERPLRKGLDQREERASSLAVLEIDPHPLRPHRIGSDFGLDCELVQLRSAANHSDHILIRLFAANQISKLLEREFVFSQDKYSTHLWVDPLGTHKKTHAPFSCPGFSFSNSL